MYKILLKNKKINQDNIIWNINSYYLYLEFNINNKIQNQIMLPPKMFGICEEWKIINNKTFYGKWKIKKINEKNIEKYHEILKKYTTI